MSNRPIKSADRPRHIISIPWSFPSLWMMKNDVDICSLVGFIDDKSGIILVR
jgi:hypothetical protein